VKQVGIQPGTKVLAIRFGAIGDVLRTVPAVRRLRRDHPDTEIGWAVENWVHPVIDGNPNIDRFHVLDRKELRGGTARAWREWRRFISDIRFHNYDVVLDFHGRFKSGVASLHSGARTRVGYSRKDSSEWNCLFSNIRVTLPDTFENRVHRYLHLLGPTGVDTSFDPSDTGIYIDSRLEAEADAWYRDAGSPDLAVFPGCSRRRSAYLRWPTEKWHKLLAKLGREKIASVIFWGPDEEDTARQIAGGGGDRCSFAPKTGAAEMMAMIGRFKAYLGYNTAAMHMAWLQGVPTAGFLGPVLSKTDAPLGPGKTVILRADEFYEFGKSKKRQKDVTAQVGVDEALAAVKRLLA
jgi:heptosyltransferase-1